MSNKREDAPPRGDEDEERSTKRARLEQDSQEERLPIMEIRRLAGKAQCREVQFDKSARVVAFKNRNDDVRINVYYTTGTVGTYLNHPRMGKTQLFRRNVDLRLLETIFENPRVHTDLGYHTTTGTFQPTAAGGHRNDEESDTNCQSSMSGEEAAAMAQVARLTAEKAALEKELADVQAIVQGFENVRAAERQRLEEERNRKEAAAAEDRWRREVAEANERAARAEDRRIAIRNTARSDRGGGFSWGGLQDSNSIVKTSLAVPSATCIALGGDAALALFEDGGFAYTGGLPTVLHNKLHSRPRDAPPPTFCAMGSRARYFIEFANGKGWCEGLPHHFWDKWCNESRGRTVKCFTFGVNGGSFFVLFTDGYWFYEGGLPSGLDDILSQCPNIGVEFISLGPGGEYFLRAGDGQYWWNGFDFKRDYHVCHKRHVIRSVYFGDDAYMVRYN